MDVSVKNSMCDGDYQLTVNISASEWEVVNLIDALSVAGGYPEIVAGKIVEAVGLVDVRSDQDVDIARTLSHIASVLLKRR